MFSEKTVKLLADLPLAIINSATIQEEKLLEPKVLLKYSKDGNLNEIRKYFELNTIYKTKQYLEAFDELGQTPLILASRYGHYDLVVYLFESGAYINAYDYDNWTPLLNACKEGHLDIVKFLVQHGAIIEHVDCGSFTPLMWACYKNHVDIVKFLIESNANPNSKCKNSISCLSWAAGRGYADVVYELLKSKYIKVDNSDKNGTTPLIWAARKGATEVCKALIQYNANPEAVGMNNWTPLIISCRNGHSDTALYLLSINDLNVNHIDKDGNCALSIAAKHGYSEIVKVLLDKGAYVNIPNKKGDSILITAVKNGHKNVVNELLSRHVEINAIGSQGKTALHFAIERSSLDIVKSLIEAKVDAEIADEDGQTPLLLSCRKKNANIVQELLNYGCKLSVTDRDGDNALHIALRNRNRDITELLLSNPKNSKFLYKPNKRGETPYKIDANNPKSIITQIFGARHLNMTEDSILGYDLYSSALAEILSEPSLNTPLTVGLYAKWGSGKSFLLSQLKDEMKSFAKLTELTTLDINLFIILAVIILSILISYPIMLWKWYIGLPILGLLIIATFVTIGICKYFLNKEKYDWPIRACTSISKAFTRLKLLLQILFLNPITYKRESLEHKNLRFIFTDYGKISTIGGERALAQMIINLYNHIEDEYGFLVTRLCRVFQHKSQSGHAAHRRKFRNICCIPTFIISLIFLVSVIGLTILIRVKGFKISNFKIEENLLLVILIMIIAFSFFTSSVIWFKILINFFKSPRMCILRALNKVKGSKIEGFLLELKQEIDYMANTVLTLDAFTHSNTRLVVIIDGLDSCEQNKVLQILEIVHVLFTKEGDPYITILAVDPHVLIKGIEGNLMGEFCSKSGSLNGHEYLRTIIHLPIYLQINLSKAKALSKIAETTMTYPRKRANTMSSSIQDVYSAKSIGEVINNAVDKKNKKANKRDRNTVKVQPMSAYDLTAQLMKNDYFLDVNPRNLRRLINIIALTGRLLRAYHVDFNWNALASWIYLVEQWPYRCSWIVMSYEENENEFNDETTLQEIYDRIKHKIQTITTEPLLALDRNGRKFEFLLENCQPPLNVLTLKKFLPCTCNLDPYLIKLIKESIDERNNDTITQNTQRNYFTLPPIKMHMPDSNDINLHSIDSCTQNSESQSHYISLLNTIHASNYPENYSSINTTSTKDVLFSEEINNQYFNIDMQKCLNQMHVDDVIDALHSIDGLNKTFLEIYSQIVKDKNINGKVLMCCDLDELKSELNMTFGDWQLLKNWLKQQRYQQIVKINKDKMQYRPANKLNTQILNNNLNARLQKESKPEVPPVFTKLFTAPNLQNNSNDKKGNNYEDTNDSKCPLISSSNRDVKTIVVKKVNENDARKVDFFINDSLNPDSNQTTISSIAASNINYLFETNKNKDELDLSAEFTTNKDENDTSNDENFLVEKKRASSLLRNDSTLTNGDNTETKPLLDVQNTTSENEDLVLKSTQNETKRRKKSFTKSSDNLFKEKLKHKDSDESSDDKHHNEIV